MTNERKSIVVAGCGTITQITHAPDLVNNPAIGSIGWVDPDELQTTRLVDEFGGVAYRELPVALADVEPAGVVIASPPPFHLAGALAAIGAGADVLLEKGGKTEAKMRQILDAASAAGVTVQMTFHQLLAIAPVLAKVRKLRRFDVNKMTYTWFRQGSAGPDGAFEDVVIHGIVMVLEGFNWRQPTWIRVVQNAEAHYKIEMFYGGRSEPAATIEVACNQDMADRELVEAIFEATDCRLAVPFRTTQTPDSTDYTPEFYDIGGAGDPIGTLPPIPPVNVTRTEQSYLWAASLGSEALLPVHGDKCLQAQVVLDAGRLSLGRGGEYVPIELED